MRSLFTAEFQSDTFFILFLAAAATARATATARARAVGGGLIPMVVLGEMLGIFMDGPCTSFSALCKLGKSGLPAVLFVLQRGGGRGKGLSFCSRPFCLFCLFRRSFYSFMKQLKGHFLMSDSLVGALVVLGLGVGFNLGTEATHKGQLTSTPRSGLERRAGLPVRPGAEPFFLLEPSLGNIGRAPLMYHVGGSVRTCEHANNGGNIIDDGGGKSRAKSPAPQAKVRRWVFLSGRPAEGMRRPREPREKPVKSHATGGRIR